MNTCKYCLGSVEVTETLNPHQEVLFCSIANKIIWLIFHCKLVFFFIYSLLNQHFTLKFASFFILNLEF